MVILQSIDLTYSDENRIVKAISSTNSVDDSNIAPQSHLSQIRLNILQLKGVGREEKLIFQVWLYETQIYSNLLNLIQEKIHFDIFIYR